MVNGTKGNNKKDIADAISKFDPKKLWQALVNSSVADKLQHKSLNELHNQIWLVDTKKERVPFENKARTALASRPHLSFPDSSMISLMQAQTLDWVCNSLVPPPKPKKAKAKKVDFEPP